MTARGWPLDFYPVGELNVKVPAWKHVWQAIERPGEQPYWRCVKCGSASGGHLHELPAEGCTE